MPRLSLRRTHPAAIFAVVAIAVAVAIPVFAASPSPSGATVPEPKASKAPKASDEPEVQVTIRGELKSATDANGRPDFTLTANGKTLKLSAGPPWFFGDKHPLLPFVGKTVTIVGEQSGDEIDVESVDGTALRAPGKPPWAGGWKRVGKLHPGWSQEKADRQAAKQKARLDACAAAGIAAADCKGNGNGKGQGHGQGGDDEGAGSAASPEPGHPG